MSILKVKKLNSNAKLPSKVRDSDAGFDLYADNKVRIVRNQVETVPTGLAIAIPTGYYAQVQERGGFSLSNTLKLKAGVIDSEYRGEVKIVFQNCGDYPIIIEKGDKIAQIVLHKLPKFEIQEVDTLDETDRGEQGFGSSGG